MTTPGRSGNRAAGVKMDKGVKCIKFLLFGFNLIFAVRQTAFYNILKIIASHVFGDMPNTFSSAPQYNKP